MRNFARALWVVSLSLCFVLQPTMAIRAQTGLVDSDEFYQRTVRRPRLPDYSPKIEALLKQMTLEEKVGQMIQANSASLKDPSSSSTRSQSSSAVVRVIGSTRES